MIQPFTAAPHDDLLLLLLRVALLLLAARLLGELALRLRQPSVVGEILAGIALGPSLLGAVAPGLGAWVVPQTASQGHLLEVVALFGAMFLLLITGLETDLGLIRRHARTAIGVSLGGILVTFTSGFLLGRLLPDDLLGNPDRRLTFALFVGTAMAISAIPVIAKVMRDLNLMRRDIGQTILASGMSDDTVGWILLSVVAGLAAGEAVTVASVAGSVGRVLAFLALSFTVGRLLVRWLLGVVQERAVGQDAVLSLVVVLTFAWGAITQALELEAVLGAFVMGILFGQMRRLRDEVRHRLESVALAVFAPVFFAVAGLKVDLLQLARPRLFLIALLVIAVATLGKVVGTYLGARLIGRRDHWTALAFGAGLNARGAMEIIIATIGLQLDILSRDMFSIIVVMAMATSLMAPTALRWVLRRVAPSEEELARLRREELERGSLVAGIHRVLIPVRRRPDVGRAVLALEAAFLDRLGHDLSITLLTVVPQGDRDAAGRFLDEVAAFFPRGQVGRRVIEVPRVEGPRIVDAILDEAAKDYDLVLLGAPERAEADAVFHPLVDDIMRLAPCPTMVVRGRPGAAGWSPRRLLVPTNGSRAAATAADVAFALARGTDAEVTVLTVLEREGRLYDLDVAGAATERQLANAHRIVDGLRERAESLGVRARSAVREGRDPVAVVLELAARHDHDLVLLGTNLRPGSERLFLGPRVERILAAAPCPVVVLNAVSAPAAPEPSPVTVGA